MDKKKPSKKRKVVVILSLVLLVLIIICLLWVMTRKKTDPDLIPAQPDTMKVKPEPETTITAEPIDTVTKITPIKPKPKPAPKKIEVADTIDTLADTLDKFTAESDPCEGDTVAPWVYPDPSGGLHRTKIEVVLHATKKCSIEWKFKNDPDWKTYSGNPINIEATSTLLYRASDSCGNQMLPSEEYYEIFISKPSQYCPSDMEYIKVGTERFCIDRFEWPNKLGEKPLSYISVYQAMDSCFSAGKRLCTMDEWLIACTGPYSWKYPYSDKYEPNACVTRDTTVRKSGTKRECRGYFDVYDMSGNLAEWTNTRSTKNRQFYNVMGGFWSSGINTHCRSKRYSYFPQNQHNPVGFRCCKDVTDK